MKPFIKWVGGKEILIPEITRRLPIGRGLRVYAEPFLGGGAVLLNTLESGRFDKYYASDINTGLINLYERIAKDYSKVMTIYISLAERYNAHIGYTPVQEGIYKECREDYNNMVRANCYDFGTAAMFMFLNRTGYNGLYRVNKRGEFNVSFGRYKRITIPDLGNIAEIADALKKVEFRVCSYEQMSNTFGDDTFVYVDPPYYPVKSNGFTSYDSSGFTYDDHKKLAGWVEEMTDKGVKVLVSSSDPSSVDASVRFMEDEFYAGYNITRVYAPRRVNSKGSERGNVRELLISNY